MSDFISEVRNIDYRPNPAFRGSPWLIVKGPATGSRFTTLDFAIAADKRISR